MKLEALLYYSKKITGVIFVAIFMLNAGFAGAIEIVAPLNVVLDIDRIAQSETFVVKVVGEKNKVSGKFGLQKLNFFRAQNGTDWVAIVAVGVNEKPGLRNLVITANKKAPFKKAITVEKKDFPITDLTITAEQKKEGYTVKKLLRNIKNNNTVQFNNILKTLTYERHFDKPFINPLDQVKVTGSYGDIRKNGNSKVQHLGVDLQAAVGTPIYAINDGKVMFAKSLPDYGNTMIISHGIGSFSLYLHLSKFTFAVGNSVKQGDLIAYSGDSGYVLGPHLHFSLKVGGVSVDPLKFIEATKNAW
jgi:murein DD-endopeptidase MepM/ murein hydrolase activator NlpD